MYFVNKIRHHIVTFDNNKTTYKLPRADKESSPSPLAATDTGAILRALEAIWPPVPMRKRFGLDFRLAFVLNILVVSAYCTQCLAAF
jgi:hypothetical protein